LDTTERPAAARPRAPLKTAVRHDTWWIKPLLTVLGLGFFAIYATARALEGANYEWHSYLSPFYSPVWPESLRFLGKSVSPAFYILIFPLAFRMTCYYYRQAYYRSFFADPPACAVPEPSIRKGYNGERGFPLILQNMHRYAMYFAVLFLIFLWYDVLRAFWWEDNPGSGRIGMGLGSLIMLANILLLSGYTFGCHSLRHLVGGKLDCFSCPHFGSGEHKYTEKPGYKAWKLSTFFNLNHMQWAWCSLGSVILTDFYIRMVASGAFTDIRFF
jgi:hypothetical protein